jgi:hypothetical protein
MLFKDLSEKETSEFRKWARDNWTVGEDIDPLWHPVVRAMCERMLSFERYMQKMENEYSPHLGNEA